MRPIDAEEYILKKFANRDEETHPEEEEHEMTPKEAFKQATTLLNSTRLTPHYEVDSELFEVMYDSLERQIPKKPNFWGDGFYDGEPVYDMWECPSCGASYEVEEDYACCPNCGQAIDLSEVEE